MQAERVGGKERSFEIIARNVPVHLRCVPELAMQLRRLFLCIKGLQSSYSSLSHLCDLCSSIQFSTLPLSLVWALLCSFFTRLALPKIPLHLDLCHRLQDLFNLNCWLERIK